MYKLRFDKIPIDSIYSSYLNKGESLYEEGFGELFEIVTTPVLRDENNLTIKCLKYEFYLKYTTFRRPLFVIYVDENDEYVYRYCAYDDTRYCEHIIAIIKYTESIDYKIDYDEIDKKFEGLLQEKREAEYKKIRKQKLEKLEKFISDLDKFDVLTQTEKMEIDCKIEYNEYRDSYHLTIRVGTKSKKYVVPSIYDFLYAVRNSSLVTYGKNFSFVHSLEAFDEDSQKIIQFLATFTSYEYHNKKEISLKPVKLENLLTLLKDKYIYFMTFSECTKYLVCGSINPKMYMDKNYILKVLGAEQYLEGYTKDYILYDKKVFEVEQRDPAYRNLLKLIMKNENFSFDYIKDVFEKKIYPRFSDDIEISEDIKDEIKVVEYNIESYFDYDNDSIILSTKYFKGKKEIDIDKLSNFPYKIKRYLSYINNLGFRENVISSNDLIYNFLHSNLQDLRNVATIYLSDRIKALQLKKMTIPQAHMSYNTGMLNVCFEESGFTDEELYRIITNLKKKSRFIKLNKNTIIEVDQSDANKLLNTIDTFKLDAKRLNEIQNIPLYQTLKLSDNDIDIVNYTLDESLKNLIKEIINFKDLKINVPKSLSKVMREYQKDAFKWMKTLIKHNFCGILADDMGLGKTLEIISVILSCDVKKPSLIVCPKSLCYNWKNEFSIWAKDIETNIIIGSSAERNVQIDNIQSNKKVIYIASYDSVRNDIDLYKNIKFNYLVLDEAQSIKNHNTLKAKSVKQIKSDHRFVLTGTPIENSVVDLWSIFDFLMPDYLGNYTDFRSKYEEAVVSGNQNEVSNQLIKKISPFVLRRTKKEVLKDLPEKIETIQIASMDKEQRLIYEAELRRTRDMMTGVGSKIEILACLTRLRQACVHPKLYVDNYTGLSAKYELLNELLDDYISSGHKVIIFSQFTTAFDLLTPLLNEKGYEYFVLTGKTSAEDRLQMAKEFNKEDDAHKIFLVSLKAGGTGLNLVGADIVIHLDPWWNVAAENQATDRAHRIGQKNVVQVIKIICENSIEQKVIELQNIKKNISDTIILSDEENYNNINLTDLKDLLD